MPGHFREIEAAGSAPVWAQLRLVAYHVPQSRASANTGLDFRNKWLLLKCGNGRGPQAGERNVGAIHWLA
jgi:hypothetical protein